jgi:hypothetical protein
MLPSTIDLALGCSTSGTMNAADIPAPQDGRLAALAGPLGMGRAARSLLKGILSLVDLLLLPPLDEVAFSFSCYPPPVETFPTIA